MQLFNSVFPLFLPQPNHRIILELQPEAGADAENSEKRGGFGSCYALPAAPQPGFVLKLM